MCFPTPNDIDLNNIDRFLLFKLIFEYLLTFGQADRRGVDHRTEPGGSDTDNVFEIFIEMRLVEIARIDCYFGQAQPVSRAHQPDSEFQPFNPQELLWRKSDMRLE